MTMKAPKLIAEQRKLIAEQQLQIADLARELKRIVAIARDLDGTLKLAIPHLKQAVAVWRAHAPEVDTEALVEIERLLAPPVPILPDVVPTEGTALAMHVPDEVAGA